MPDAGDYPYRECGHDNVWLANGFTLTDHPNYGELISIEDVHGLHARIERAFAEDPHAAIGAWRMERENGAWRAWRQLTSEDAKAIANG